VERLYRAYRDRAEFLLVYIREAHPSDGRQAPANVRAGVVYATPTNEAARAAIASDCVRELGLSIPCVVDDLSNTVQRAYAAWPARVCAVAADGTLAYAPPAAPAGVTAATIEEAVRRALAGAAAAKGPPSRQTP